MSVLTVNEISKSFGDNHVLEGVSLHLEQNELVCLLGASGCGKTTLFNIISGLMEPDAGTVIMQDADVTGKPGRISYMQQKDLLLPFKTVLDNVCLPLVLSGKSKKQARAQASPMFAQFGLDGTQNLYPHEISGGMRQRAALLRTYLFSKGVALLDEPFSALDTITKGQMHSWYLDIMRQIDLPTLFITHDIDEAIQISDRIYVLGKRERHKPTHIAKELVIDRPRGERQDFALTEEFLTYKREILHTLQG